MHTILYYNCVVILVHIPATRNVYAVGRYIKSSGCTKTTSPLEDVSLALSAYPPHIRAVRKSSSRLQQLQTGKAWGYGPAYSTIRREDELASCHACLVLSLQRQAHSLARLQHTNLFGVHTCAVQEGALMFVYSHSFHAAFV